MCVCWGMQILNLSLNTRVASVRSGEVGMLCRMMIPTHRPVLITVVDERVFHVRTADGT